MSTTFSAYDTLVENLLLPQDIREVVQTPFLERGYPLDEWEGYDVVGAKHVYLAATYNDQKIVLLHLLGEIIADYANFKDVLLVANLFTRKSVKSAGLFFFARVKDLNPDFNNTLAVSLAEDYATIKAAHFFHQGDIDSWRAKPPPLQKKLVTSLLALDALLPPRNGTGPEPRALSEIREKVIELLFQRYETAQEDPREFFVSLRSELSWPPAWEWEPKAHPRASARDLVHWLLKQGSYPRGVKDGYEPLGDLLCRLIPKMGREQIDEMYQIIVRYQLVETDALREYKQYVKREFDVILPD
jgi:hypothetical protein